MGNRQKNSPWIFATIPCLLLTCVLGGCDSTYLYQDKYFRCDGHRGVLSALADDDHDVYGEIPTMHLRFLFGIGSVEIRDSVVLSRDYDVCETHDQMLFFM